MYVHYSLTTELSEHIERDRERRQTSYIADVTN